MGNIEPGDDPNEWLAQVKARERAVRARFEEYLADERPGTGPLDFGSIDVFVAATAQQAHGLYAVACEHPAACQGNQERIWIVSAGHATDAWTVVPPGEAAPLRARYHLVLTRHAKGLSIFLLERDAPGRFPDAPRPA